MARKRKQRLKRETEIISLFETSHSNGILEFRGYNHKVVCPENVRSVVIHSFNSEELEFQH
jgi:hypothetical protein